MRLILLALSGASILGAVVTLSACQRERPEQIAALDDQIPVNPSFTWDVRPILSENCFQCHGNDATKRKAGLRLDIQENAYAPIPENKAFRAIVPGKPWESQLIARIMSEDPDKIMPPKAFHKLTPIQQAMLYRWIEQGAKYEPHWAYLPPKKVSPGRTDFDARAITPIDRYIYDGLKAAGLRPSPEADKETLINRVTLDLTGLPPTLAEVDAFLADKRPDSYERLVDRLLASPRYGERMASYWLDVARFGDSDGYQDDGYGRLVYPWRDWVISAFNRNLPYDQFVTWQLAGDKLKNPKREQLLATTFGRVGKRSTENGINDEEYRVEYRNERAELVGKAFLGLTVSCARCHDHKYDAISQSDYYSFAGFFNSIDERGFYAMPTRSGKMLTVGPTLPWPTADERGAWDKSRAAVAAQVRAYAAARRDAAKSLEGQTDMLMHDHNRRGAALRTSLDRSMVAYYPFDDTYRAPFGSIMVIPHSPAGAEVRKSADIKASSRKPVIPSDLTADKLSWTQSGRAGDPGAVLQNAQLVPGVRGKAFLVNDSLGFLGPREVGRFERSQDFSVDLWIKPRVNKPYESATIVNYQDHNVGTGDSGYTLISDHDRLRFDVIHMSPNNMISVATADAIPRGRWTHVTLTYDGSSRASGTRIFINGKPARVEVRKNNLTRSILPASPFGPSVLGGGFHGFSFGKRFRAEEFTGGAIDELRIYGRALTPLEIAFVHNASSVQSADKANVRAWLIDSHPGVVKAKTQLRQARSAENAIATGMKEIMVLGDLPKPRPTYILNRGIFDQPTTQVPVKGLDRVFKWDSRYRPDRLGLSEWLFDKKNPLTARVFVNRLWQLHFGTGIVETVEDFGTQGSKPANLPLLDWLSITFMKSGWNIKHMQKLIVMSATYRQSSTVTQNLLKIDPRNRLLARGPRYRLPAEMIRDNALAASGLLVTKIGGDSVFPYQPEGVWSAGAIPLKYPANAPDDDQHRRSMYTFIKRASPPPSMAVFDQPDRSVSTVARQISNTPLQALVLLNDVQYTEAYRKLAERAMLTSGEPAKQIVTVFRLATRRRPYASEMSALGAYYKAQAAKLAQAPGRVNKILGGGVAPVDPQLDRARLAALTMVTAGIMNSPDAYTLR